MSCVASVRWPTRNIALERSHTGNALVNAGVIATTSLIKAATADERWSKILGFYSKAAGERLKLIDEVYKSEAATNQGNRALAALNAHAYAPVVIHRKLPDSCGEQRGLSWTHKQTGSSMIHDLR